MLSNTMTGSDFPKRFAAAQNRLLAALTPDELDRLSPQLQSVSLSLGESVCGFYCQPEYAYFPTSSVISLLYTMENGDTAEMGIAGKDGVVNVASFLGGGMSPNRATVQVAGGAFRIKTRALEDEFAQAGVLQRVLLLYTQSLLTQISQTAVCNRLHPVEKRLCRWLLLTLDRVNYPELQMTQEFIAHHLGGRRESVTVAAGRLQDAGLIHYARGHIRILDRRTLEQAACECYWVVRNEEDRLFSRIEKFSPSGITALQRFTGQQRKMP
jgi:CRP-like cAMP-binding protein